MFSGWILLRGLDPIAYSDDWSSRWDIIGLPYYSGCNAGILPSINWVGQSFIDKRYSFQSNGVTLRLSTMYNIRLATYFTHNIGFFPVVTYSDSIISTTLLTAIIIIRRRSLFICNAHGPKSRYTHKSGIATVDNIRNIRTFQRPTSSIISVYAICFWTFFLNLFHGDILVH